MNGYPSASYNITNMVDPPMKKKAGWEIVVAAGLIGFVGILLLGFWAAFVIMNLWTWFLVPLGAPVLNVWHIWGLLMIFRIVAHESGLARHKTESDSPWLSIGGNLIGWGLVLLTGWILSGLI